MMDRPILVTPPAVPLVTLAEAKAQCRVDSADDDALIGQLIAAATGYMDGWGGILGRACRAQVWRQEFETRWGRLTLALPDVAAVAVSGFDAAGGAVLPTLADVGSDGGGWYVETEGPGTAVMVRVDMTCALSAARIETARLAALLLIGHWHSNREAVADGSLQSVPLAFDALIAPLRWRSF